MSRLVAFRCLALLQPCLHAEPHLLIDAAAEVRQARTALLGGAVVSLDRLPAPAGGRVLGTTERDGRRLLDDQWRPTAAWRPPDGSVIRRVLVSDHRVVLLTSSQAVLSLRV